MNIGEVKVQKPQKTVLQFSSPIDHTGIGNYARWVSEATGSFSSFYILSSTRNRRHERKDRVIYPINLPLGSGYNFSTRLPKLAYHFVLSKTIQKEWLSNHCVIAHYLTPTIPYIGPSKDIVTVHDIIPIKFPDNCPTPFVRLFIRFFKQFKGFNTAIVTTDYVRKDLEEIGFEGSIRKIPYPIDPDLKPLNDKMELRKKLDLPLDKQIILNISSAEPRKNLKLVRLLFESKKTSEFFIRVGNGLEVDRVYTNIGKMQLQELYNASDVLIAPSLEEGFGLPPLEGAACGLPIVVSDREFFHETLDKVALFADPLDVSSFRMAINEAYTIGRIPDAQVRDIRDKFSFENFASSMKNLYSAFI